MASLESQSLPSQTVPHTPLLHTSTLPSVLSLPPAKRVSPSEHDGSRRNSSNFYFHHIACNEGMHGKIVKYEQSDTFRTENDNYTCTYSFWRYSKCTPHSRYTCNSLPLAANSSNTRCSTCGCVRVSAINQSRFISIALKGGEICTRWGMFSKICISEGKNICTVGNRQKPTIYKPHWLLYFWDG